MSKRVLLGSCLALVGLGCVLLFALRPEQAIRASYHVDLRTASSGGVAVTLRLSGAPASLEFGSTLSDDFVDVSGFSIEDGDQRPVAFTLVPPAAAAKVGFSRFVARPGNAGELTVRYEIQAPPYWPKSGAQELRRNGAIAAEGVALSLPGLLLLPSCTLAETTFSFDVPDGWRVVEAPAQTLATAGAELWRAALVAGDYRAVREPLVPKVELSVFTKAPAGIELVVEQLVQRLEQVLGEPAAPLHLVLAPWQRNDLPVELPGQLQTTIVDLRDTDPESLRGLVRALVPRWFGRTPTDMETNPAPESWFLLGLDEYLALTLPVDLGLFRRDIAASIEWAWMRNSRRVNIVTQVEDAVEHKLVRREMATALMLELTRILPPGAFERALLAYDGTGYPVFEPGEAAQRFAAFLEKALRDDVSLSFEGDWHIDLEHRPVSRQKAARVEKVMKFAFTSDTEGYIEGCGCKLAQSGGIAHRAEALRALRAKDAQLTLLDLGNFSPIKAGRARLDALMTEEYRFYLAAIDEMGYDAACVGPGEFYSNSLALREASEARTPFLGLGIEVGGEAPFAPHVVLKKNGLRVGVIGFSEVLEPGLKFQAQERNMAGVTFPTSPEALLADVRELRPDVDLLVVTGRMQPRTLRELCKPENKVDLVLLGGYDGYRFLTEGPSGFLNDTAVACHQIAGYGFSLLTLFLSADGVVEVQHETMSVMNDQPIQPDMQRRIDRFYREIGNRHELLADMEPLFAWDPWQRDAYVGADACRQCHVAQHDQWSGTPHARAMETLVAGGRQNSPKCVQCHVVGFEAESGFRMAGSTPQLAGVQCEICHGAGAEHVRTQKATDIRKSPPARVCFECHDKEHAESFSERLDPALESVRH